MKKLLLVLTILLLLTYSAIAQPSITSVFPNSVPVNAPAQWIEVNGVNLSVPAQLKLNGVVQPECNVDLLNTGTDGARKIRFCLGPTSFTTPGEKDLVVNIGGADSNPLKFVVGQVAQTFSNVRMICISKMVSLG